MTRIIFPLLFFAILFPFHNNCSANDPARYRVEINTLDQALVEYTFTVTDSILHMSGIGANHLENQWATFVDDLSAASEDGKTISLRPIPNGQWSLNARKGQVVKLRYRVVLDHEKHDWSGGIDGVAYKREYGVFYSGRSLFIMNDRGEESIVVDFHLPRSWKVSTVWDRRDSDLPSFSVDNYSELSESMLFAGNHEQMLFKREGFELLFALGGEDIIAKKQEYQQLAEGVLDYYIDLMGGAPRPSPKTPFHRAFVVINPASESDGEVIGNCISILESDQKDPMAPIVSRFIYAHELFHLWNGKSFSPSDLRCEWFKEGVSNYYTFKALYRVGVLNEDSYFGMLNAFFYKRYTADPGVGTLSLTQGKEKHDHWGVIYSGGLFAGISQDMIIREATGNKHSLDDLMQLLFKDHGGTDTTYTLEDLQNSLTRLSGQEQGEFFKRYVLGSERIPIHKYLKMSGLDAEIQNDELKVSRRTDESAQESQMIRGVLGKN